MPRTTSGKYTTELSQGWEVKTGALDVAWQDIAERVAAAKEKVAAGRSQPAVVFYGAEADGCRRAGRLYRILEMAGAAAFAAGAYLKNCPNGSCVDMPKYSTFPSAT